MPTVTRREHLAVMTLPTSENSQAFDKSSALRILFQHGPYYRVWPYVDQRRKEVLVTVGNARSFVPSVCKLLKSVDIGNTWDEICNFAALDARNTTTGQPFITREGVILVCVWDVRFYQYGNTWLAIYRSEDEGETWQRAYCNSRASYGKHFFQSNDSGTICLGIGIGGGGQGGRVGCTPSAAILLRSEDEGESWQECLRVQRPTPLYDGIFVGASTSLVTARDINAVYRTEDGGASWKSISVPSTPRCITKVEHRIFISSDSSVMVSSDKGLTWTKYEIPIRNLMLRYPVKLSEKILMSGVGWRSLLVAIDQTLTRWYVAYDISSQLPTQYMTRMSLLEDSLFLGDEIQIGALAKLSVSSLRYKSMLPYAMKQRLNRGRIEYKFERDDLISRDN